MQSNNKIEIDKHSKLLAIINHGLELIKLIPSFDCLLIMNDKSEHTIKPGFDMYRIQTQSKDRSSTITYCVDSLDVFVKSTAISSISLFMMDGKEIKLYPSEA